MIYGPMHSSTLSRLSAIVFVLLPSYKANQCEKREKKKNECRQFTDGGNCLLFIVACHCDGNHASSEYHRYWDPRLDRETEIAKKEKGRKTKQRKI